MFQKQSGHSLAGMTMVLVITWGLALLAMPAIQAMREHAQNIHTQKKVHLLQILAQKYSLASDN